MYLFELEFSPGVGLLGHMITLFFTFKGTSILFSETLLNVKDNERLVPLPTLLHPVTPHLSQEWAQNLSPVSDSTCNPRGQGCRSREGKQSRRSDIQLPLALFTGEPLTYWFPGVSL